MSYAVCVATCVYCGEAWRPIIECSADYGMACDIECPHCHGKKTGHVRVIVGHEQTIEAAIALAESIIETGH